MYYLKHGFHITTLHVDGEFAPLQAFIQDIPGGTRVNLKSDKEHVPGIERQMRAEKESIRSIGHRLPFSKVSKLFLVHLVFKAIKILNHFNVKMVTYDTISPTTIMTGESLHLQKSSWSTDWKVLSST